MSNLLNLIENIYPNLPKILTKKSIWIQKRAILSPTNEQVNKINDLILLKFNALTKVYHSVDTVLESNEMIIYPTEFLNSLSTSRTLPYKLILKVGSPLIIFRNLSPPKLFNGTRLQIKSLKNCLLECITRTGCGARETVLVPRIPMIPINLPFQFRRLQFPTKLSFAITINKAQGQKLNVI
jgi:ATP-dependent DNA helicase PIF1